MTRIVAMVPEATPKNFLSTELMIAFVLERQKGRNKPQEEKVENDNPGAGGFVKKTEKKQGDHEGTIPMEDTTRGSTRSDNLPVNVDRTACMSGCETRTRPAAWGLSFLMYCR
jgi:hypothetical protein